MINAGQDIPAQPTLATTKVRELRVRLIAEELLELCEALNVSIRLDNIRSETCAVEARETPPDSVQRLCDSYDAILDLLVVVIGTGVALGLELEPGWEEVHRSNMSKFIDGYRREDGKWVKGPSYSPADLRPFILDQMRSTAPDSPPV